MGGATHYISRIGLEWNGQEIDDFESFSEGEVEYSRQVKLMGKTGFADTVPRYTGKLEYVIPKDAPEFDFTQTTSTNPATLTIDYLNGTRKTYRGVVLMKTGEIKYNSEKEAMYEVSFGATDKRLS